MGSFNDFLDYLQVKRRYSERTVRLYGDAVWDFLKHVYPEKLTVNSGAGVRAERLAVNSGAGVRAERPAVNPGTFEEGALGDGAFEGSRDAEFPGFSDEEVLEALRFPLIRGYVASLLDRNLDARTVNLHLSALSTFCNYLVKQGKLHSNPVKEIVRPKEKKRLPSFYTPDILEKYFESPPDIESDGTEDNSGKPASAKTVYCAVRNRLIVALLFGTGLRRAEAASLRTGDIDLSRKTINIIGKGNKQRMIPLPDSLCQEIEDYLLLRDEFISEVCSSGALARSGGQSGEEKVFLPDAGGRPGTDAFFLTDSGKPVYLEFLNRVVKSELSGIEGISGRKTPHTLRHSYATALLNNGADLNSIKEVLGHSSLAATEVYTHNSFEKLKEIYKTAHPRAKE
ncbi:MAG: tyrosine-type recombinase/integrase [Bacteroidales bacterium]|nr:tyrosine-type recombinase/integrase [Bacteroidales bacterium]